MLCSLYKIGYPKHLSTPIISPDFCLTNRKKKRHVNHRSSFIIPRGIPLLPGDASFPKTRADNDSRVYTTTDETGMYGHFLQQDGSGPGHFNGHQVDSYHTFTAPMDETIKDAGYEPNMERGPDQNAYCPFLAPSETFIPSRPRTPLGHVDSMDYEDRRMVDQVLHTFKTLGDPNPICLSAVEPEPEPEGEYEETM